MEFLFSLILVRHCSLSLPLSNPQLPMAANFGLCVLNSTPNQVCHIPFEVHF
jgi:hypothetical protein